LGASVEKKNMRIAFDEPSAVEGLYTLGTHGFKGSSEMWIGWFLWLYFHWGRLVRQGTDETVSITELGDGDRNFSFDNGVYTADLVGDLPSALEKQRIANISFCKVNHGGGWESRNKIITNVTPSQLLPKLIRNWTAN
jgi:hypothetical protein